MAVNRAIAIGKALGPDAGLAEIDRIADGDKLKEYPFYPAAQAELRLLAGRPAEAAHYFQQARALARTRAEHAFFERKLQQAQGAAQGSSAQGI